MRCYYNTSRWGYNIANYLNMESPIRIIVRVCRKITNHNLYEIYGQDMYIPHKIPRKKLVCVT